MQTVDGSHAGEKRLPQELTVAATGRELPQAGDIARPSFMQHRNVLKKSGLAHSHKTGHSRIHRLSPERFKQAERWFHNQRLLWEQRFDQLDD